MADSEEQDVWDREAERAWKNDAHHSSFTVPVNQLILSHVPKGQVLDAGCSIGKHLLNFKRLGYEPVGVEQSEVACEYARILNADVPVHHMRLQEMPWIGRFVLVHTSAVLQHNIHERKRILLAKFREVLQPDGFYLLTENIGPDGFGNSFSLEGWRKFLDENGFRFIDGVKENNYWLYAKK